VRLFEHPDFEQAVIRAAEHFRPLGLREAIIEKDYYVTETLRIIEQTAGPEIIFKGGTSLSKGWGLIQRFSEDIDIFVDPTAFDPPLGKKGIDRELKKLRLFCLAQRPEVEAMLRSEEYAAIKVDYDRISAAHFPKSYVPPPAMSFAQSDALFPAAELREMISSNFEAQCRVLCFGPFPSWDEVQARLEHIRHLL